MKIAVYDEILRNWEAIPGKFALNQLLEICDLHQRSVFSIQKQLVHMRQIGLIELNGRKTYTKVHKHLDTWFRSYLLSLDNQPTQQAKALGH